MVRGFLMNQIINLLQSHPLTDILSVGYINSDDTIKKFHIIEEDVYLEFGNSLLRCSSVNQYDKLRMKIVNQIEFDFDFELEEDDEFCVCSVFNIYLFDPYGTNQITSAEFLVDERCNIEEGIVKCAKFNIGIKDELFLDPTHTFGMKINENRTIKEWIEKKAYGESEYSELVWNGNSDKMEIRHTIFIEKFI